MNEDTLSERSAECPYCGESIELLIDPTQAGEIYIEDCFVCCRPIQVSLQICNDGEADHEGGLRLRLYHENEVPGS